MVDYQEQYNRFNLNDELKNQFRDFETVWGTKEINPPSYGIISLPNNNIQKPETKLGGEKNGKLA